MFSRIIPAIDNLTRITRNTTSAIDHIITNTDVDTKFMSRFIQTDKLNHFSIIFLMIILQMEREPQLSNFGHLHQNYFFNWLKH